MTVLEGEPDAEVTLGGGAHGVAGHHPEQLAPGRLVRRRHLVVSQVGLAEVQTPGQVADEMPGVGQRVLDAGGERGVVDVAAPGPVEQVTPGSLKPSSARPRHSGGRLEGGVD